MTEYELTYLFNEMYDTSISMAASHTALVSAAIVGSFTGAHLLNRNMMWVVLGIYTWSYLLIINLEFRQMAVIRGLFEQIREFNAAGKGLGWHPAAQTAASVSDAIPYAFMSFGAVVYVATLVFFFQCRKLNSKPVVTGGTGA